MDTVEKPFSLETIVKARMSVGYGDDIRLLVSYEIRNLIMQMALRPDIFLDYKKFEFMGVPVSVDERLEGFDFEFVKVWTKRDAYSYQMHVVGPAAFPGSG